MLSLITTSGDTAYILCTVKQVTASKDWSHKQANGYKINLK